MSDSTFAQALVMKGERALATAKVTGAKEKNLDIDKTRSGPDTGLDFDPQD